MRLILSQLPEEISATEEHIFILNEKREALRAEVAKVSREINANRSYLFRLKQKLTATAESKSTT